MQLTGHTVYDVAKDCENKKPTLQCIESSLSYFLRMGAILKYSNERAYLG